MADGTHDERRLADLKAGNARREQQLGAQGVRLDPVTALRLNLDVIRELLVGDDHDAQVDYETRYQERLAAVLDQAEAEVRKIKLAQGNGGLVIPGPHGHG